MQAAANDAGKREAAIKRLKDKEGFQVDLVAYLVVNAGGLAVWAVTGHGFFWPVFPMVFWGVGLVLHGYTVYMQHSYTETEIQREMGKLA